MFEYSVESPLSLSLKKSPLAKGRYADVLNPPTSHGKISNKPAVSVVVVAYNEGDELIEALRRVYDQSSKAPFEVILIDNGLDEATKAKLADFNLTHVVMNKNIGCSAGRNVGALLAKSPVLAFVDADGFVDDKFIEECLSAIKQYPSATRGRVLPKTKGSETPPSYDLGDKSFSYYINAEGISVWNKELFVKSGGFEDVLYGGEGIVLQNRMIEVYDVEPLSFGYSPNLFLYHDYNSDKAHFKEKQIRYEIITRKIHTRYPFLKSMIAFYNERVARDIPKPLKRQRKVSSKIEKIRLDVGTKFGKHYREQYSERVENPDLVNGSSADPQFSVVIPCFNVGARLNDAIESVLRQSIPNMEIIVVDDVSAEAKTLKALEAWEGKVKLIRHKVNQGVAAARNTGVNAARAPYVLCLDGDDTIEPEYLEEAYNVFESDDKVGLVSAWVRLTGARGGDWKPKDHVAIEDALIASPVPTATCFRKSTWKEVGGYDENMRGYEDWNYWISILAGGWKARVLPRDYFNYTISPGSKVNTSNKNALDLVGKIFDNHEDLYKKHARHVITHKFRDYAVMRSEYIELKSRYGERNTVKNLFRISRYPNYARRAYKKGGSFLRMSWESKDPVYSMKLLSSKMRIYSRNLRRKLGF